jgi:hypothetical protein
MPTLGVTYDVRQDPQRPGRWIVLRGGKPSGGFGTDMNMAINGAIGEAKQEARTTDLKIKVVLVSDGKRTVEWESP